MKKESRRQDHQRRSEGTCDETVLIGSLSARRFPRIWVAASQAGLIAISLGASRADFEAALFRRTGREVRFSPDRLESAASQIREYLRGERSSFQISIDWSVIRTSFHRRALAEVLSIPYGQTRSYKQIAVQIRRPHAVRAVGRANATNPLPLVIPCHRVIGADGTLRGYGGAGGIAAKAWLLKMEASHAQDFAWQAVPGSAERSVTPHVP